MPSTRYQQTFDFARWITLQMVTESQRLGLAPQQVFVALMSTMAAFMDASGAAKDKDLVDLFTFLEDMSSTALVAMMTPEELYAQAKVLR
jgi:hypothetical protein